MMKHSLKNELDRPSGADFQLLKGKNIVNTCVGLVYFVKGPK
jgi:hypothetical protein